MEATEAIPSIKGEERGKMTEKIKSVRGLVVYKKAFDAAMRIFEISKAFLKEK
jgi:hypothetical protein